MTRASLRPVTHFRTPPNRALIGLISLALSASFGVSLMPSATAEPGADATYIVKLRPGVQVSDAAQEAESQGITVEDELHRVFTGMVVTASPDEIAELAASPDVAHVEPDQVITASQAGPDLSWGLDRIDQPILPLDQQFADQIDTSAVTAYVIDSGIYAAHQEFTGRVRTGYGTNLGQTACTGHGTHVAGIIGGTTFGVAKQVKLVPVQVLGCDSNGKASTLISAMEWVIDHHPSGSPAVANLSLGTSEPSTLIDEATERMVADGITVIAAAGNSNSDACQVSPARASKVISVAASNQEDQKAWFSNFGTCTDLFAPGQQIISAGIGSVTATDWMNGTSQAAPFVAGAAAVVLARHPSWNPTQVRARLLDTAVADVIEDPGTGSPNLLLQVLPDPLPIAAGTVSITGSAKISATLTATPDRWPSGTEFGYQWFRGSSAIPGAVGEQYLVTKADAGTRLKVKVTGTLTRFLPDTVSSAATSAVPYLGKMQSAAIKLTGTAKVGKTLKAQTGTWKPGKPTLSYQWYRAGAVISGATKASHKLTKADKGRKLMVKITGTLAGYQTVIRSSDNKKVR